MCGGASIFPYRKGTFDPALLDGDRIRITDSRYGMIWDLFHCGRCTHVFANPCPSPEFIRSLYEGLEDPLYQEEEKGRSRNFLRILKSLERLHPERGRLFDVGAATGILMDLASRRGWQAEGIEPSSWAVRTARERYGLDLIKGPFETASLPLGRYEAVTMVDFIEHIPHPLPAVRKARDILAPGGTLCLVTPDIRSAAARLAGGRWWHFRPAHLGFFTSRSLGFLLQEAGLRPVLSRKYSWTFSAHYLLSRKPAFRFLLKNPALGSLWKRIPVQLALRDSFEVYARKD